MSRNSFSHLVTIYHAVSAFYIVESYDRESYSHFRHNPADFFACRIRLHTNRMLPVSCPLSEYAPLEIHLHCISACVIVNATQDEHDLQDTHHSHAGWPFSNYLTYIK